MKYNEAGDKIEALSDELGVELNDKKDFYVVYRGRYRVAYVSGASEYGIHADYTGFKDVPEHKEVFNILVMLAATPLDKREDKKRYVKIFDGPYGFLNLNVRTNRLSVYDGEGSDTVKTKFTDREIEKLKQRASAAIDWHKVRYWDAE